MRAARSKPILAAVALFLASAPQAADGEPDQLAGDSFGALPGVARLGVAGPLSPGTAVAAFAGYGFTGDVLPGPTSDSHHRALSQLAVTLRTAGWLGFGVRLDGRYDKHLDVAGGEDDGWVGDPRLLARATGSAGDLSYGAQLSLWFPGGDAPSLIPEATSADALLLGTYAPAQSPFTLSGNLGFRLDRSAESIEDAMSLSLADRMALGASDANALLAGVGATYRTGSVELLAEWTWDLLLGDDAPAASESPMRMTGGARFAVAHAITAQVLLDLSLASTPELDQTSALVPIEPRFQVLAGLHYRFAGKEERREQLEVSVIEPAPPPAILEGRVLSGESGVAGAKVTITSPDQLEPIELTAGEDGSFRAEDLKAGAARVSATADGYQRSARKVRLSPGQAERIELVLEPEVPPGQLRGVVRSMRGKALRSRLTIEPIGAEFTTDEAGAFEIDLPPGDYEVVIQARGHAKQHQEVRIEKDGVTIINVDMKPRR